MDAKPLAERTRRPIKNLAHERFVDDGYFDGRGGISIVEIAASEQRRTDRLKIARAKIVDP